MDECTEQRGSAERSTDQPTQQRVCVVGGTESTRRQVADALQGIDELQTAAAYDAETDAIDRETDCVILAGPPPDGDGVALLSELRDSVPRLPIVLFAPPDARELVRRFVRHGGTDIVYADSEQEQSETTLRSDLDRLRQRVDVHCRQRVPEIADTVLGVAGTLMGATPDELDTKIEWGLKSVGERLGAACCLVYRYDADTGQLVETHSWQSSSIAVDTATAPQPEQLAADQFPGFEAQIKAFDRVTLPGVVDDRPSLESTTELGESTLAADHSRYLETRSLGSLVAVPIVIEWELEGLLAVGTHARRPWPRSVVTQLSTLADLVGDTLHERRQRQALEAQNERLERFASVISHDLQNPLNVISGYAEVIRKGGDVELVSEIAAAADRMDRLLSDMLTLTREGDSLGAVESVELAAVVEEAWSTVDTDEATLQMDDLDTVEADDGRLQQAIENLFRNAIEHGGDVTTVRVEGTQTGFAVEDDGQGIPADRREAVFEEGYTDNEGTGLGLTIVETVVDAHGWSIELTVGRDGGARFEIEVDEESD